MLIYLLHPFPKVNPIKQVLKTELSSQEDKSF